MKNLSLLCVSFILIFLPSFAGANTTVSGVIASNQTWTLASSTFIVSGTVTVNPGVTLTINPGVIVKFTATGTSIINKGILNAVGNATNTIYFTSYSDDSVGGDTNANGASVGTQGNWTAIETDPSATTTLKYAQVRYSISGIYNTGGTLTLATTTATSSSQYGLWAEKGFVGNNLQKKSAQRYADG